MNGSGLTSTTLEEISATPEWRALGSRTRRILSAALTERNLMAVLYREFPQMSLGMQRDLAAGLLKEHGVQTVVNLYALAMTPTPAVPEPVRVPAPPPVDESAIGFDDTLMSAVSAKS